MQITMYNSVCTVEGQPQELAIFLAFHLDSMARLKERRDAEDVHADIARLWEQITKQDDGGDTD